MRPPAQIDCENCLLLFDIHENLAWVRSVLEREEGNFDHLLLGGDYFDGRDESKMAGPEATCAFLRELAERFGPNLTVLLGNHDVSYLEAVPFLVKGQPILSCHYRVSGFSVERARTIAKHLAPDFLEEARLFQVVNGWLVSHAGVAAAHWPEADSVQKAIFLLDRRCAAALATITDRPDPLLAAGEVRGGFLPFGGLTWLDFRVEFKPGPVPPLPQAFGHTPTPLFLAKRGNAWCLDGQQTRYGLLSRAGELDVKGALPWA